MDGSRGREKSGLIGPSPLSGSHILDPFDCGKPVLNDWLKITARRAEARSARTYVVCDGNVVVGYYCLSAGGVLREQAPAKLRRNMPSSVPVMVLGRLAVNTANHGCSIGAGMLRDAMLRTVRIAGEVGVRAMMAHAIDDEIIPFYLRYGFIPFPDGDKTLYLPVETMVEALRAAAGTRRAAGSE